jgi:hypothetical protein
VPTAYTIPGYLANECADFVGSLVGDKTHNGQLEWSAGDLSAVAVDPNDFGAPVGSYWGLEKVVARAAKSGQQSWRVSRGFMSAGAYHSRLASAQAFSCKRMCL